MFDQREAKRHRLKLYHLIQEGFPPIAAMARLIERVEQASRNLDHGA